MTEIDLTSKTGYRVRLTSPGELEKFSDQQYLAGAYLPGVTVEKPAADKANFTVNLVESDHQEVIQEAQGVSVYDHWLNRPTLDYWHLLYSIFRLNYLGQLAYPVHASCLGEKNMVLLVGHTGVGKTTITMRMVNDFGWKIYSGNKTVVDPEKLIAVAGTKTISIRENDLARYPNLRQQAVNYSDRTALFLDPDHYDNRSSVPLSALCIARIDDGNDQVTELNYPGNLHALYPFFMDTVYADTILAGGQAVYSGDVSLTTKEHLSKSLATSLQSIKVINIRGSVKYLTNQIKGLI